WKRKAGDLSSGIGGLLSPSSTPVTGGITSSYAGDGTGLAEGNFPDPVTALILSGGASSKKKKDKEKEKEKKKDKPPKPIKLTKQDEATIYFLDQLRGYAQASPAQAGGQASQSRTQAPNGVNADGKGNPNAGLALVEYTKSATGELKGVMMTHENLMRACHVVKYHVRFGGVDPNVTEKRRQQTAAAHERE
ncbi:hypothetical protein HK102_013104, partial [Quaeritorhiza haematococci]